MEYGKGDGRYNFSYMEMESPIFDTTKKIFPDGGALHKYVVIKGIEDKKEDAFANPFSGYLPGNKDNPVVYKNITDVIKMLDMHTPKYDTATKTETPPAGDPFKYVFDTHTMATKQDLDEGKLTADLLAGGGISLENTILGSDGAKLSPKPITFSADIYKKKRQENIDKKNLDQSLYDSKQVSQTEVSDQKFRFNEAKRVTIARAFYDHGVRNKQLAGELTFKA